MKRFFYGTPDNITELVKNIDDDRLEEIILSGRPPQEYRGHIWSSESPMLVDAAKNELNHRKDQRREERTERLISLADTRIIELLKILESIASKISNKPKTAFAVVIFGTVTVGVLTSVLISLINFLGYQAWVIFIVPFLMG
jgi:hypothetical protein